MSLIKTENFSFSYNGKNNISDISFSLDKGKILFLIGHNGAGKSTLLKALCGLLKGYGGEIFLEGENLKTLSPKALSKKVAYVPGEIYSPFDFSAQEIVLMGRNPHKNWWESYNGEDFSACQKALEELNILHLKNKSVNKMSTGERHLVFLAQALASSPKLLLLDEPASHLDLNYKLNFFSFLSKIKEQGISSIIVSHEIKPLFSYGDLCLAIKNGEKAFFDKPDLLNEEILASVFKLENRFEINKVI